jgi:hypothetical protein
MFKLYKMALEDAGKPLTTRETALAVIRTRGCVVSIYSKSHASRNAGYISDTGKRKCV